MTHNRRQGRVRQPELDLHTPIRPAAVVQSYFKGCIAATAWRRADAEALLPAEVELRDRGSANATVIFLIGEQSHCAAMLGQVPVVAAPDYREMLIAVAGIRHHAAETPFVYIAQGYSTSPLTVFNGNHFYGFAKQRAQLCWQEPFFLVTDDTERLLWHVQVQTEAANDSTAWTNLHEMLRAPILGRTANGSYVTSYFDWDLSQGSHCNAAIRFAEEANVASRTEHEWTSLPQRGVLVDRLRWRLSWPTPL